MNYENKKILSEVTFETTTRNKELQERIVEVLKEMSFEIKIYFHVGIPDRAFAISIGVIDSVGYRWEAGFIRFDSLEKLSDMSNGETEEIIRQKTESLVKEKLIKMKDKERELFHQLEIYSKGIQAFKGTPLIEL